MKRITALVATLIMAGAAHATEAPKPNMIWIMAEDMGTDLECYGMAGVKTPNLNRMAEEGMLFTRAYCANPICSPSRSSMMVGAHQTSFNAHHHRSNRDTPLAAPYKPITSYLRDAGYTCILGSDLVMKNGRKIDCNFKYEETGPYDGVEHFGIFDKLDRFGPEDQPFFNQIQCVVTHRGDWWNPVRKASKHPVSVDAVELPPWIADTPETRYDWAAYLDTVEYMDDEVGQIMQRLKDTGLEKNTFVIFIADNGRCNLRGKGYLQETGIHVPMIVWGPGIEPGTVIDELVCTTDISATVLKLAGAEMPSYLDGRPVFGVADPQYRDYVRSARDIWDEVDECSRSVTTKKFSYIKNHMPEVPWDAHQAYLDLNRPAVWVMRSLKKEGELTGLPALYMADSKPAEELYDLQKDPDQLNNLATNPEYAEVLKKLRALEKDWQSGNRDMGLEDLGKRVPEQNMRSVAISNAVKENAPDEWARLEAGELMETQSWKKYLPKKK
ncbi:Arylsulfatase [Pontiella desulfatans]|uniref:Arylsulfatase n=1 Tax=Pontiella desulfatans TaxID=2750659 RepID=A0A6C2U7C0_PONDE|nr:sulfatase [Pontiella desulfatans]SPS74006.1 sulfatase S1_8 [Kiritimatiellales bacterium]VGO15759.1 Arylsulfatase [Pontiella desulfatans]